MEDVFGIFRFTFETYLRILDLSLSSDPVVSVAAGSPGFPVADSNACGAGRVSWPPPSRHVTDTAIGQREEHLLGAEQLKYIYI